MVAVMKVAMEPPINAHADAIRTRADAAIEKLESDAESVAHDATTAMREASSAESAAWRVIAMHDEGMLPVSQLPKDVLALIEQARRRGQTYVYLGYHVADCRAMRYKADFRPCEVFEGERGWRRLA